MKNEFQITPHLYQTWLWENMRKPPKAYFLIFWAAFSLLIAVICITEHMGFLSIFAVFCVYRAFFRDFLFSKRQYALLARNYGGENWTRTVSFEEHEIVTTEGGDTGAVTHRVPYGEITRIEERDNKVWLFLQSKMVIRLYKDRFVDSTWEECSHFLETKMNS